MVRRAQAVATEVAEVTEAMLAPAALAAISLALWRLSADFGWTGGFPIAAGLWSHWQVWLAIGVMLWMADRRARRAR